MTKQLLETREYPRVLIVSNDCLSRHTSNGRTLRNFLTGWPPDRLAQFYLQNNTPDPDICTNYFRLTDQQALRAFLGQTRQGGPITPEAPSFLPTATNAQACGIRRNALTMLARELVWNSRRWETPAFRRWVDAFAPEVVLLQAGDCPFMLRLAEDLARQYAAPLVIYNSESDYFKDFDYFRARGPAHWCYPLFRRQLQKQYRHTLPQAAKSIYICQPLQAAYDREFGAPSETICTATQVRPRQTAPENPVFRAAYLGNLGLGRHKALMDIGRTLHHISESLALEVYGAAEAAIQNALEACPGIRYRGVVPYGRVLQVMADCDLLVHAESFDPLSRKDLRYAFSTKIPDSLASGACFLLYAPAEVACTAYLRDSGAAWVVTDPSQLRPTLQTLVEDPGARKRCLTQAAALVEANHSAAKNAARFQELLRQAAKGGAV